MYIVPILLTTSEGSTRADKIENTYEGLWFCQRIIKIEEKQNSTLLLFWVICRSDEEATDLSSRASLDQCLLAVMILYTYRLLKDSIQLIITEN